MPSTPAPGFEALADRGTVYPSLVEGCDVGGETVPAQDRDFYRGGSTDPIAGPSEARRHPRLRTPWGGKTGSL